MSHGSVASAPPAGQKVTTIIETDKKKPQVTTVCLSIFWAVATDII